MLAFVRPISFTEIPMQTWKSGKIVNCNAGKFIDYDTEKYMVVNSKHITNKHTHEPHEHQLEMLIKLVKTLMRSFFIVYRLDPVRVIERSWKFNEFSYTQRAHLFVASFRFTTPLECLNYSLNSSKGAKSRALRQIEIHILHFFYVPCMQHMQPNQLLTFTAGWFTSWRRAAIAFPHMLYSSLLIVHFITL